MFGRTGKPLSAQSTSNPHPPLIQPDNVWPHRYSKVQGAIRIAALSGQTKVLRAMIASFLRDLQAR